MEIATSTPEQTYALGQALGSVLLPGDCVALIGELGAGKTLFVRGAAAGAATKEQVVSPSFQLMVEYAGRYVIRHLDAYFSDKERAFMSEAATEIFDGSAVVFVEWADRVIDLLPPDRIDVSFMVGGENARILKFHGSGQRANARILQLKNQLA